MKKALLDEELLIFTENIIFLRKEHGLSKKKMAKLLGTDVNSLNKLERGELPPQLRIDTVFNIARHFNISPKDQFSVRFASADELPPFVL